MASDANQTIRMRGDLYRVGPAARRLWRLSRVVVFAFVPAMAAFDFLTDAMGASSRAMAMLMMPLLIVTSILTGLAMRHAQPVHHQADDASDPPVHPIRPFWPLPDRYLVTCAGLRSHRWTELGLATLLLACTGMLLLDEAYRVYVASLILTGWVAARWLPRGTFHGARRAA